MVEPANSRISGARQCELPDVSRSSYYYQPQPPSQRDLRQMRLIDEEVSRLLAQAPPEAIDDSRFWKHKGWLHAAQGELSEAETAYRKALELNCYDHVAQHQLAGVLGRLRRLDQVEVFEKLHREGALLRREILESESVNKIPIEILQRMARHAKACGDDLYADQLSKRLQQWGDSNAQPPRPRSRLSPPFLSPPRPSG